MYKLVVADDEDKLLSGLCDYYPWGELGFEIVGRMKNGEQVLKYLYQNPADVILTDISMPVMNGIELAEAVARDFPEVTVVFLSGYADFKYARDALKYKVRAYVLKPVKTEELAEVFVKVLAELDEKHNKVFTAEESYYGRVIGTIKKYVVNHLAEANLERAAELVNLSSGYLSCLFKQETQESFSEFVQAERMKKAKVLLSDPAYKTYQISVLLGYENPKNFSRAFRAYYGQSPREFRRAGEDGR